MYESCLLECVSELILEDVNCSLSFSPFFFSVAKVRRPRISLAIRITDEIIKFTDLAEEAGAPPPQVAG